MATQMGYGQFFDILDDMNLVDTGDEDQVINISKRSTSKQFLSGDDSQLTRIINHFFKTMEQLNLSESESTDSLRSGLSSSNLSRKSSTSDIKKTSSQSSDSSGKEELAAHLFYAVQSLTLNNYGSNNSLNSLDVDKDMNLFMPQFMEKLITTFDEFMHNHENTQQNEEESGDPSAQAFPKLC